MNHPARDTIAAVMSIVAAAAPVTIGSSITQPANAAPLVETIALSGEQAPAAAPGVTFLGLFAPAINAAGQVAFTSSLSGPGVDGSNNIGIYSNATGALAEVARTGSQAPGATPGVLLETFFTPRFSSTGQTAFEAIIFDPAVNDFPNLAIYRDAPGTLAPAARPGDQAPAAAPGVVFNVFDNPGFAFNASGQIAFTSVLIGPTVDSSNNIGVYSEGSGTLAEVARRGNQAPNAEPGVSFSGFGPPVLNSAGRTAFRASLGGTGVNPSNSAAIFSEGSGPLAQVARTGQQAPGTAPGVLFVLLEDPVVNAAGQTAFAAFLTGPAVNPLNSAAIYSEGSGTLAQVARAGAQAPGAATGVVFAEFNGPVLNATGQLAFRASLNGTGVDNSNDNGIYREISGTLTEVAREGNQAPDAAPGVTWSALFAPSINAEGQIAFAALLAGPGVDSSNNTAIYATDADGVLVEVVRTGNPLDTNDDPLVEDLRTVRQVDTFFNAGNGEGRRSSFND